MRRLLWMMAYPLCVFANKCGILGYTWVNVSYAAWRKDLFDPLWHHRWFGDAIEFMPDQVNLCGIMYRVSVAEGLVLFSCGDCMSCSTIQYTRDPHDQYAFLWYLELSGGRVPACHVECAYQWVQAVYGGSHVVKTRPVNSRPGGEEGE